MPLIPRAIVDSNGVTFQINNFHVSMTMPGNFGVVDIISQAADLWHGSLRVDIIMAEFRTAKLEKLSRILQIQRSRDLEESKFLDFQIKILRHALHGEWRLPALLTKYQDKIIWHSGGNRLVASVMCHKPLAILLTDYDGDGQQVMTHARPVLNDAGLCARLGVDFRPYIQGGEFAEINTEIHLSWDGLPGPCPHYIRLSESMLDWSNHHDMTYLPGVIEVLDRWGNKPRIKYFCDDPGQVRDSMGIFDLEHAGPGLDISPSEHAYKNHSEEMYVCIRGQRHIDLAELLFWLDPGTDVYLDRDDGFAVRTKGPGFNTSTVSLSLG